MLGLAAGGAGDWPSGLSLRSWAGYYMSHSRSHVEFEWLERQVCIGHRAVGQLSLQRLLREVYVQ